MRVLDRGRLIVDAQELEAALSNLLTDMEGERHDRHEIHLRLVQILSGMRAFGMPLPDDLVRLEHELEADFGPETE